MKKLLFFILLLLPSFAWAEWSTADIHEPPSDWSWNAGGFVVGKFSSDYGYDPGIGLIGEAQARWRFLEAKLTGSAVLQKKKHADSGYTWRRRLSRKRFFFKRSFRTCPLYKAKSL